jgi:hypothetical protein
VGKTTTPWTFIRAGVQVWEEQEDAFKQVVSWTKELGGTLFYVFANAGIGERKWIDLPAESLSFEDGFRKPNFEV